MGRIFVVFIRPVAATIPALRRIRPFVCARLHEARGVALAGCFVLDLESARDRLPHRAQFHQAFTRFVFVGGFAFQVWIAERVVVTIFSQSERPLHYLGIWPGRSHRGGSLEQAGDSLCPHRN
jgi:hypothetical protein